MRSRNPFIFTSVAVATIALATGSPAIAQQGFTDDVVRIGILNDMSGPYTDASGPGSVQAAQWAVDDFGGSVQGKKIEILNADTQLKPDIATTIARRFVDTNHVDAMISAAGSPITIAGLEVAKGANVALMNVGGLSSDLSGKFCNSLATHWVIDTYAAARMGVRAGTEAGAKTWFFIAADYSFGQALQRDAEAEINRLGGKVLGGVRVPLGTSDFSSFLLQAQNSKADIIALANAGGDTTTSLKQASEFGIQQGGQKITGLVTSPTDIYALGLTAVQGLYVSEGFFWDRNDATRAFAKRFADKFGNYPTANQAAAYAATMHYLRAVDAAKTDNATAVSAEMKKLPVKDFYNQEGSIREDGRVIPKELYLLKVKKPAESKSKGDIYDLVATVPGTEAFRTLEQSECPLVKK